MEEVFSQRGPARSEVSGAATSASAHVSFLHVGPAQERPRLLAHAHAHAPHTAWLPSMQTPCLSPGALTLVHVTFGIRGPDGEVTAGGSETLKLAAAVGVPDSWGSNRTPRSRWPCGFHGAELIRRHTWADDALVLSAWPGVLGVAPGAGRCQAQTLVAEGEASRPRRQPSGCPHLPLLGPPPACAPLSSFSGRSRRRRAQPWSPASPGLWVPAPGPRERARPPLPPGDADCRPASVPTRTVSPEGASQQEGSVRTSRRGGGGRGWGQDPSTKVHCGTQPGPWERDPALTARWTGMAVAVGRVQACSQPGPTAALPGGATVSK